MRHSVDPIWTAWIKLFNYHSFSDDLVSVRDKTLNKVAFDRPENEKLCAILALSVSKWHPSNPNRGNGTCFCCEHFECKIGDNCPAMAVCGPNVNLDKRLFHLWYISEDEKETEKLADKIYWIMLKQYRKALKEVEMTKQTKHVMKRHLGKRITHADVESIPEGIELLLEEKLENPKDADSDSVLRCVVFDDEGRQHKLGDFGGVKNVFRLEAIPQHLRMQVYTTIARAADKVGAA